MTGESTDEAEEARGALASIDAMRRAGVRRGQAPRGLRILFALVAGGFVAAQATPIPWAFTPLFLASMIVFTSRVEVVATPRPDASVLAQVMILVGFAAVVFAVAMGAAALRARLGLVWAPLALGVVVAAGTFLFTEARTRAWAARQIGEAGQ